MEALQLNLLTEHKRYGTVYDLPAIEYVNLRGSYKSSKYSIREWIARSFYEGSRQMGLDGWDVPHEALRNSVEIASGVKIGRSTWFEIQNTLEEQGDIIRETTTIDPESGSHKAKTTIHFCAPLYISAEKRQRIFENPTPDDKIIPLAPNPTREYMDTPVQEPDSSPIPTKGFLEEHPTREIIDPKSNNTKEPIKKNYDRWIHPILFTILCVFRGFDQAVKNGCSALAETERQIFDRAQYELANPQDRRSFVDWAKWATRNGRDWQEMHQRLRESIAEQQIIPYLADTSTLRKIPKKIARSPSVPLPPSQENSTPPTAEELGEIRAVIRTTILQSLDSEPKSKQRESTFDSETLRELTKVRDQTAARARNMKRWDREEYDAKLSKLGYTEVD